MHPRFWRSTVYLIIFKNHYCWRSHEYINNKQISYLVAPQPYGLFLQFPYLSVWMFLELLHTLDTNLRLVYLKIDKWACIPNQLKMHYQIILRNILSIPDGALCFTWRPWCTYHIPNTLFYVVRVTQTL